MTKEKLLQRWTILISPGFQSFVWFFISEFVTFRSMPVYWVNLVELAFHTQRHKSWVFHSPCQPLWYITVNLTMPGCMAAMYSYMNNILPDVSKETERRPRQEVGHDMSIYSESTTQPHTHTHGCGWFCISQYTCKFNSFDSNPNVYQYHSFIFH